MIERFLCALLLLLSPCAMLGLAEDSAKPVYTVEAVRYGTLKDFSVAGLVLGADKSRKMDIAMVYWLVRGMDITSWLTRAFIGRSSLSIGRSRTFRSPPMLY